MGDIKQKMADQEIIRNAEALRREKLETKAAKERVKAQIEADRQARKVQFYVVGMLATLNWRVHYFIFRRPHLFILYCCFQKGEGNAGEDWGSGPHRPGTDSRHSDGTEDRERQIRRDSHPGTVHDTITREPTLIQFTLWTSDHPPSSHVPR